MAKKKANSRRSDAERMASQHRQANISEYFDRNIAQLGFNSKQKALVTAVKEGVDNALDACEEFGILPSLLVQTIPMADQDVLKLIIRDNGPGIPRKSIDGVFAQLLYGSKFHRVQQTRGQQGIGISAAGMYGLKTTGQPVRVVSKPQPKKPAFEVILKIDVERNCAEILEEREFTDTKDWFPDGTGVHIEIPMKAVHKKGRQSVDAYLEQTAIANPHAEIEWRAPSGEVFLYERSSDELPPATKEIDPHPHGVELGDLERMLKKTPEKKLGGFFNKEFSRFSPSKVKTVTAAAKLTPQSWVASVEHPAIVKMHDEMLATKFMAPSTDCLAPIDAKNLLRGLSKEIGAEFFAAETRSPSVWGGSPFLVEAAIAYGGKLPGDEQSVVYRFANRVPLIYQQSGCACFRAVQEVAWKGYGLSQPRGALPVGPLVILLHVASTSVPFTNPAKEAVAEHEEIAKEMKLALQKCGQHLKRYLSRRNRMRRESERRDVFHRYIGEIAANLSAITGAVQEDLVSSLTATAQRHTEAADVELDDEGNVIEPSARGKADPNVLILETASAPQVSDDDTLFGNASSRRSR